MRKLLPFLVVFLGSVLISAGAQAAKRVALVIGNAAYENVPVLANPKNDASDMAAKLRSLGFDVVEGLDLGLRGMRGKIGEFVDKLDDADLALFFYAGHGLQVDGNNYLVPVDSNMQSSIDLRYEAMEVSLVLREMENRVETNIVFLDACRDNPLARSLRGTLGRSTNVGRGLAQEVDVGQGTLISFATEPGKTASDGTDRNSPYTAALVKYLGEPGVSLGDTMIKVRNNVIKATKNKQVPWEHSSLTGRVVLKKKGSAAPVTSLPKPSQPVVPAPRTGDSDLRVEMAFWDAVKNADSAVYFETYLRRYPEGLFADIARLKIASLKGPSVEPVKPTENPVVQAPEAPTPKASSPEQEETQVAVLKPQDLARQIMAKPDADDALRDRAEIAELQEKLHALNFEPGKADGVAGRKTREAIRAFQASVDIDQNGNISRGIFELLKETPIPDDWGNMGFRVSGKRIFSGKGLSGRAAAESDIRNNCRNCDAVLIFSGKECASIALSNRGWGWAVRKSKDEVKTAALNACSAYGGGCQIKQTVCANGR